MVHAAGGSPAGVPWAVMNMRVSGVGFRSAPVHQAFGARIPCVSGAGGRSARVLHGTVRHPLQAIDHANAGFLHGLDMVQHGGHVPGGFRVQRLDAHLVDIDVRRFNLAESRYIAERFAALTLVIPLAQAARRDGLQRPAIEHPAIRTVRDRSGT